MGGAVGLVGVQVGLAVVGVVLWGAASGGLSVVPALGAWLAGAAAWTAAVGGGLARERVRRLAWWAGLGHGALLGAAYLGAALNWPEAFGPAGETPVFGALVTGFLSAMCAMVLTLCGMNAWNEPWGGLNGDA